MTHSQRNRASRKLATATEIAHDHDHDYSGLLTSVRDRFAAITAGVLFQTDCGDDLFDIYLDSLPTERQVHNCHACRDFIRRYGGLVAVEAGKLVSVMWPDTGPNFYSAAFSALQHRVERAKIVAPFYSPVRVWGTPLTEAWSHLAVVPPTHLVYKGRALTAAQAMAAAKENYRTVATALGAFKPAMLDEALRVLRSEKLRMSERFVGPVQWLRDLHDRPKGRAGVNAMWLAVATAPEGYCHPRSSVVAPLLDDIEAGLPFAEIKARFDTKVGPLVYQRPQAPPSAGNIREAEALVERLGIAPSLERRFARLEECQLTWVPKPSNPAPSNGVFGHIKPKSASIPSHIDLPATTITWEKFARTVLPDADDLEFDVPPSGVFIALTTAVHEDAPPILKWDSEEERNPVAWYVHAHPSQASRWNLRAGWTKVTGITPLPTMWGSRPLPFLGNGMILLLTGAADQMEAGNALFPACLKDELHGARATIEAYSRTAKLHDREQATACGYDIRKDQKNIGRLRTLVNGVWNIYQIDRWD